jgi:hypothetical protein
MPDIDTKFKRCTLCGREWKTREEFLADKEIHLEGYQWNHIKVMEGMPPEGILVFTHTLDNCGTSLALAAKLFKREFDHKLVRKYGKTELR